MRFHGKIKFVPAALVSVLAACAVLLAIAFTTSSAPAAAETSNQCSNSRSAAPPPPGVDLQPGVEEFIANTYLSHIEEYPDPNEPVELLRLYLEGRQLLADGRVDEAIALFTEAVARYPACRHAHAGLGAALWQRYESTGDLDDLHAAVKEFIRGAEIGMNYGKVRYTYYVGWGLAQLGDAKKIDDFFGRALQIRDYSYLTHMHYAQALSWLGDARAEEWYKKAIEIQPEGNIDALASYAEWLLDQDREADVLHLISPDEHVQYLHFLRGVALERLGKAEQAKEAYAQYVEFSAHFPAPTKYRIEGSRAQEGIVFESEHGGKIGLHSALLISADQARLELSRSLWCEASTETQGGMRMVGWTVRTRLFRGATPSDWCYGDIDGSDSLPLADRYHNTIFSGQFCTCKDNCYHSATTDHVAYDVWWGLAPDPLSGYCACGYPNRDGTGCDYRVHCSCSNTNGADYYGPMAFHANWCTWCTGAPWSCSQYKGPICGNGDSDNIFYNHPY